ncbi:MAG: hypothetical protein NVS2B12_36380 [Ktedonobacteraceae bacterium]
MTEYQLRIYRIRPGTMAEFVEGWRKHIIPLREQMGFKVLYAFEHEQNNEFIWLLSYDGPGGYAAGDAAYYASPGRRDLTWDPKPYMEGSELRILTGIPLVSG